jgi:predicted membrane channel-forming protein YqfA (hemolysin III family)
MGLFAFIFALTVVGAILYLYMSGACQVPHMRPFRFAVYILLLICAMTLGIGLIQDTRP